MLRILESTKLRRILEPILIGRLEEKRTFWRLGRRWRVVGRNGS
jgi:hypothetical protein